MAQAAETLRCNVCEVTVEAKEAKEHAASEEHNMRKQKLEGDWKETASRKYSHDNSVVVQWASSIHEH